jgi:WD40 repeat protein
VGVADFIARRTITAHHGGVTAVAFSRDSSQIASADERGDLALWSVADGTEVWTTTLLDPPVESLAFASTGTLWALTASGLYAVAGASGAHGPTAEPGTSAAALAISPAGDTIALGDMDGSYRLLNAADLTTKVSVPSAHAGGVTALRISANGQRLVTGGADGTTALWDLAGNLLTRVSQPNAPVTSVDLNADGTLLAAGQKTTREVLAFLPDGTTLGGGSVFPFYARLSRDGAYLISITTANRADRIPVDPAQFSATLNWDDYFDAAAFSPDGRYVAEGVANSVRLWDTETGEMVRRLDGNPPIVANATAIAFSPDGTALARDDGNGNLDLLRTADGALLTQYGARVQTRSVAYSPDGQWLATPGAANVLLWKVADGSSGPSGFVGQSGQQPTALAFAPDGRTLAVGDAGGNVTLWSFPDGTRQTTFAAVTYAVHQLGFSPDGGRLVVGDDYGHGALFTSAGTLVVNLFPGWNDQASVAFASDGQYLASLAVIPVNQPDGPGPSLFDILLLSPLTGSPLVTYGTADITGGVGSGYLVSAPSDHRLLLATGVGRLLCLP